MSQDLIVKANALVEASYHLTANEQRLILSAVAQIPKQEPVRDDRLYIVGVEDFTKLGVHPKTAYRELEEAMQRLFDRMVTVKIDGKYLKTRWVQSIGKLDKEMIVKMNLLPNNEIEQLGENSCVYGIQFSHQVLPFLANLSENFTKYKLTEIAEFSSAYSFRIYEFMMQFQSTGYIKISLNELRERLQIGGKYPASKDLKVRVIDIAIKEINKKSPYKVEYNLIKTGKKFTHLELKFKKKDTAKKTKENESRDPNTVDMLAPIKMTDKQRQTFASKLAELRELGDYAPIGMSMKEYAKKIESDLLNPQKAEFYRPYLAQLGFVAS